MKKVRMITIVLAVATIALSSCRKPYQEELYVDIKANETAFLIPLEQGTKTDQKQLKSQAYMEQHKVATKRVYTPTTWHQTGRYESDGKWIPTVIVITVDRSPITREWTKSKETGTSTEDQRIEVESQNSIGFSVGVTCTASIPEEDASTFLYYYSGKTLAQVMDNNVRSYVLDNLTGGFGLRDLTSCQNERTIVFNDMKKETTEFFAKRGIRIDNIGAAGQFEYIEKEIQTAINLEFVAKKKNDAADNEVKAANKFASASSAIAAQKNLDADINIKNAFAELIRSGKLSWPQSLTIVGKDMGILDIYGAKNLNKK